MLDWVWLILLFPLAGVLITAILGRWLNWRLVGIIATLAVGASFVVAVLVFFWMLGLPAETDTGGNGRQMTVHGITWILSSSFKVEANILLDQLSILVVLVVTGVSTLIHVYSMAYMEGQEYYSRYFTWLNLFVLMMLILVLSDNFVTMYLGWEGVGLCSYLLIGYWFEKKAAADAGKKAFLVNRVGDFGFALGIMLLFATFGSVTFADVFPAAKTLLPGTATAIALLLFLGATGKSAQIPLYVWLPDAMEGPTPVSALIHAATMVTAGVYLVVRCYAIFEASPSALDWVLWIGIITAFLAATMAMVQKDFKRILAYSTISQLGFMFLALGAGAYTAGVFHLTTHAFFKALLFLCAGGVMHALAGELDIFKMGGLKKRLRWTFGTFLVGILALSGVPLFSGFFSKDEILLGVFEHGYVLPWILSVVTASLTAFYAFRLLFVAFYGKPRMDKKIERQIHESPAAMVVPMVILAGLAVVGGYIGLPGFLRLGNAVDRFLEPVFADSINALAPAEGATVELSLMAVSAVVVAIGFLVAYWLYIRKWGLAGRMTKSGQWLYDIVYNKYYVDEAFMEFIVKPLRMLGDILADAIEQQGIDRAVNGLAHLVALAGEGLRQMQTGLVRNYALAMLIGVVVVLAYFVLRSLLGF